MTIVIHRELVGACSFNEQQRNYLSSLLQNEIASTWWKGNVWKWRAKNQEVKMNMLLGSTEAWSSKNSYLSILTTNARICNQWTLLRSARKNVLSRGTQLSWNLQATSLNPRVGVTHAFPREFVSFNKPCPMSCNVACMVGSGALIKC